MCFTLATCIKIFPYFNWDLINHYSFNHSVYKTRLEFGSNFRNKYTHTIKNL